jgi:hypothetical protein
LRKKKQSGGAYCYRSGEILQARRISEVQSDGDGFVFELHHFGSPHTTENFMTLSRGSGARCTDVHGGMSPWKTVRCCTRTNSGAAPQFRVSKQERRTPRFLSTGTQAGGPGVAAAADHIGFFLRHRVRARAGGVLTRAGLGEAGRRRRVEGLRVC